MGMLERGLIVIYAVMTIWYSNEYQHRCHHQLLLLDSRQQQRSEKCYNINIAICKLPLERKCPGVAYKNQLQNI